MKGLFVVLGACLVLLGLNSLYIVDQREQVLVMQFGESVDVVKEPGLHFKVPVFQNLVRYDSRLLDHNAKPTEVIDNAQKPLVIDAFVKYFISDPRKFYVSVNNEVVARQRLNTFLDSSLRQVMGEVPLSTLLTGQRAEVMKTISDDVKAKAADLGMKVVDVRIMRADFPVENSNRIYERMKTEREREAKEFRAQGAEEAQRITSRAEKERSIILAEAEKTSQITRGEGEAISTKIFADAFGQDESFFDFYRSMQAYKETLSDQDTTMVLSPDSDFLKYFGNIGGSNKR